MRWLVAVIYFGFVWLGLAQPANPENIFLEGYTFTRPANWKWEAPHGISLNRFVVPDATGNARTDIAFFYVTNNPVEMKARILSNFDQHGVYRESSFLIGKTNLLFLRGYGTVINRKKHGPLPDHALVGTVLPSKLGNKWFFVRIFGPDNEVQAAESDFKKMVKRAVEDAE